MRFLKMEPTRGSDVIITVEVIRGWLWWKRTETWKFIGSGTVWRYFPSFNRAETFIEARLCDMQKREEYAHLQST